VDNTLRHVVIVKPFREINIGEKYSRTTVQFLPNGHVMGSNSILIKTQGDSGNANILFTGDMGKPHQSLCGGYLDQASQYPNDPIDVLVVESTNFLREPISFREKQANLLNEIQNVWKNGGNPLLPTLSFHRFQEIIEILHNNQGKLIPEDCKIFIDAPLGMTLLEDFKELDPDQLTRRFGDEANYYKTIEESLARFNIRNVTIINSHEDSIRNDEALANYRGKAIIIASGGMGGYGRAVNYIHGKFGQNPQNTILFTCYQVEGTEGAALVRRENASKNGRKGARVIKVEGFTSHISGPKETFAFLNRFNLGNLRTVIITHGKDEARQAMAAEFRRKEYRGEVILPVLNQRIKV
jgi:metallo-beta-lactamase family protein